MWVKPFLLAKEMHYYQKNIGDYAKRTGNLTALEHGVYNLLMDGYFDHERGPTLLEAMRWARAKTEEEKSAVLAVLDQFFVLVGDEYTHSEIVASIVAYKVKSEIAQENGKKGGRPPKKTQQKPDWFNQLTQQKPDANQAETGSQPNQEPLTTNQEPVDKVKPIVPAKAVTGSVEAQAVFAYWQEKRGYQRAKLDAKRLKAITSRLKDGYSVEDLCKAIDGIARSPHHMGENDRRTMYDDIELICRDGPKVDNFMKLAGAAPGLSPRLQHQVDVLNEWMSKP